MSVTPVFSGALEDIPSPGKKTVHDASSLVLFFTSRLAHAPPPISVIEIP